MPSRRPPPRKGSRPPQRAGKPGGPARRPASAAAPRKFKPKPKATARRPGGASGAAVDSTARHSEGQGQGQGATAERFTRKRGGAKRKAGAADQGLDRLQKVLAHAGVGSRRACEELILQGRVTVAGQVVRELGSKVDPGAGPVAVDGQKVHSEKPVYFAVHKPKGYVSTNSDPAGKPRVVDLLPEIPQRVYSVGRLDEQSTGLMLLTNDGELANKLAHPKFGVEKIYRVVVAGEPGREVFDQLTQGVWLAEGKVRAKRVRPVGHKGQATILEMVLGEGKNREIRRMLARLGHKVMSLTRIAVGPIGLKGIAVGGCRPLTGSEVDLLRRAGAGEFIASPKTPDRRDRAPSSQAGKPSQDQPVPGDRDGDRRDHARPAPPARGRAAQGPGSGQDRPRPSNQGRPSAGGRRDPYERGRPSQNYRSPSGQPQGRYEGQGAGRPPGRPHDHEGRGPRPHPGSPQSPAPRFNTQEGPQGPGPRTNQGRPQGPGPRFNQGDRPQPGPGGPRFNQGDRPQPGPVPRSNQGGPQRPGPRPNQDGPAGPGPRFNQGGPRQGPGGPRFNQGGPQRPGPRPDQGDRPQQGPGPRFNQGDRPQPGPGPRFNQGDRPQGQGQGYRPNHQMAQGPSPRPDQGDRPQPGPGPRFDRDRGPAPGPRFDREREQGPGPRFDRERAEGPGARPGGRPQQGGGPRPGGRPPQGEGGVGRGPSSRPQAGPGPLQGRRPGGAKPGQGQGDVPSRRIIGLDASAMGPRSGPGGENSGHGGRPAPRRAPRAALGLRRPPRGDDGAAEE